MCALSRKVYKASLGQFDMIKTRSWVENVHTVASLHGTRQYAESTIEDEVEPRQVFKTGLS